MPIFVYISYKMNMFLSTFFCMNFLHLISLAYFYLLYTIEVVQGLAIITNKMLTSRTGRTFLNVVFLIIVVVPV
jgi:hypothetical protein